MSDYINKLKWWLSKKFKLNTIYSIMLFIGGISFLILIYFVFYTLTKNLQINLFDLKKLLNSLNKFYVTLYNTIISVFQEKTLIEVKEFMEEKKDEIKNENKFKIKDWLLIAITTVSLSTLGFLWVTVQLKSKFIIFNKIYKKLFDIKSVSEIETRMNEYTDNSEGLRNEYMRVIKEKKDIVNRLENFIEENKKKKEQGSLIDEGSRLNSHEEFNDLINEFPNINFVDTMNTAKAVGIVQFKLATQNVLNTLENQVFHLVKIGGIELVDYDQKVREYISLKTQEKGNWSNDQMLEFMSDLKYLAKNREDLEKFINAGERLQQKVKSLQEDFNDRIDVKVADVELTSKIKLKDLGMVIYKNLNLKAESESFIKQHNLRMENMEKWYTEKTGESVSGMIGVKKLTQTILNEQQIPSKLFRLNENDDNSEFNELDKEFEHEIDIKKPKMILEEITVEEPRLEEIITGVL